MGGERVDERLDGEIAGRVQQRLMGWPSAIGRRASIKARAWRARIDQIRKGVIEPGCQCSLG